MCGLERRLKIGRSLAGRGIPELVRFIWLAAASCGSAAEEVLSANYSIHPSHLGWAFRGADH